MTSYHPTILPLSGENSILEVQTKDSGFITGIAIGGGAGGNSFTPPTNGGSGGGGGGYLYADVYLPGGKGTPAR